MGMVYVGVLGLMGLMFNSGASAATLLDELTVKHRWLSPVEVQKTLDEAENLSVGETHNDGQESKLFNSLYLEKWKIGDRRPRCLVESFKEIFPESDVNYPLFRQGCEKIKSTLGNGPGQTVFKQSLTEAYNEGRNILTHSGFRHVLPWGLVFPFDFQPARIDFQEQGTIVSQWAKQDKRISHTVSLIPFEELVYNKMRYVIYRLARENHDAEQFLEDQIHDLNIDIERVEALANSKDLWFNLDLASNINPRGKNLLWILKYGKVNFRVIEGVLRSDDFKRFIGLTRPNERIYGTFVVRGDMYFGSDLIKDGGLLFFTTRAALHIQPDGTILLNTDPSQESIRIGITSQKFTK
ncbi:MAG: hypothetical protein IT289_12140 [Oligoflexia bacterium]|nr:hypothetical protein [Oligoflexia bacterium]